MKKSINIEKTENGIKYFHIYEVKVQKHDGEILIYDRYLNENKAEETAKWVPEVLNNLYATAWVREQIIWC
jgi:hypothetical protein